MSTGTDNYWYQQGRYGGNQPDNFTSDQAKEKYSEGRGLRELDRQVDETLRRMNTGDDGKSNR